jgi:hypothetical protein
MSQSTVGSEPEQATEDAAIRPFRVDLPEAELTDLRRRIAATRWPERETVGDQSQGVVRAAFASLREGGRS